MIGRIVSTLLITTMVLQPLAGAEVRSAPDTLSPALSFAKEPLNDHAMDFFRSLRTDASVYNLILVIYKTIIEDGSDINTLSDKLSQFPFWENFWFRKHLAAPNFIGVIDGDILNIKLQDRRSLRICTVQKHDINENGSIEDYIAPDAVVLMKNHIVQYFDARDFSEDDRGDRQNMIRFGPAVSYSALDFSDEFEGMYMTAVRSVSSGEDRRKDFVALAEEGSSERAVKFARILDRALDVMGEIADVQGSDEDIWDQEDIWIPKNLLKDKKDKIRYERSQIRVAYNLHANSMVYLPKGANVVTPPTIVFNYDFVNFFEGRWAEVHAEKDSEDAGKYSDEGSGVLIMIAERIFHEICHAPDDVAQAIRDMMFYKLMKKRFPDVMKSIEENSEITIYKNNRGRHSGIDGLFSTFGKHFGSDLYFKMIQKISKMPFSNGKERNLIRKEIRAYLKKANKNSTSELVVKLTTEQRELAREVLGKLGINDDLFGGKIYGKPFKRFFRESCLFSSEAPFKKDIIHARQKKYIAGLLNPKNDTIWNVKALIRRMYSYYDKDINIEKQIENRKTHTELETWIKRIASITYPQNYQRYYGKLHGRVYYNGLNLLTLPILPVNEKNNTILWRLFRFNVVYNELPNPWKDKVMGPPEDYYKAKKISLYEYVIDQRPFKPCKNSDEMLPGIEGDIARIKGFNDQIDQSKTAGNITHIIIDENIPAVSQRGLANAIEKFTRGRLVSEKIIFRPAETIAAYLSVNDCNEGNTLVFLGTENRELTMEELAYTGQYGKIVLIEKESPVDFVNIEALVAIARSLLNKDFDKFDSIYRIMTGKDPGEITPALSRVISIAIPSTGYINIDEQIRLNELLKKSLTSA